MSGFEFDSPAALWIFASAPFLGIAAAWLVRLTEGSAGQRAFQALFFGVMVLMGAATVAALAVGPGCWVACSTTLAVMVLTATLDFRGSRESATW
jgi:hypothetical protein